MSKKVITTDKAPQPIGTYSQAVVAGKTVYISGQIGLDPATMTMVEGDFSEQVQQVFANLSAVAVAAGGSLADVVKLNIYLTDMADFAVVSEVMAQHCQKPYPARAAVAVKQLPKNASVEMEAVLVLGD